MANAENAKPGEDDGALLAVEATESLKTEPVTLQEPDRGFARDPQTPLSDPPNATSKASRRPSGVVPFVLGAAIFGGAAIGLAKYVFPETGTSTAIATLQNQLDAQKANDTKLQSDLAALSARAVSDTAIDARVGEIEAAIAALPDVSAFEQRIGALEAQLTAIAAASVSGEGAPAAALAAMDGQIKDLKAALAAQTGVGASATADIEAASAAAQARLDAAEAAAETAAKQAALSHIRAAFESGAPLGPALNGLKAMGADVPAALSGAVDGVPSLMALQEGFADPARVALDASIRSNMGNGWASRLTSFLRTQSGARSLTPRDGTDPDAVLSRAEAALRTGQIKAALTELAGLPPEGAAAMAPWIADATRRLDTEQAISDLSATLNGQ